MAINIRDDRAFSGSDLLHGIQSNYGRDSAGLTENLFSSLPVNASVAVQTTQAAPNIAYYPHILNAAADVVSALKGNSYYQGAASFGYSGVPSGGSQSLVSIPTYPSQGYVEGTTFGVGGIKIDPVLIWIVIGVLVIWIVFGKK